MNTTGPADWFPAERLRDNGEVRCLVAVLIILMLTGCEEPSDDAPPPPRRKAQAGCPDVSEEVANYCRYAFNLCLESPWQPFWNRDFGKKKPCPDCYANCLNEKKWPAKKCPQ
jgi:hypothetical protein